MAIRPDQRAEHLRWLTDIAAIPTASGREFRVVRWIEAWCAARPDLALTRDAHGNLHVALRKPAAPPTKTDPARPRRPVYLTAHLDHPAFVVERVLSDHALELSFRGGVMDDYFKDARVTIWSRDDAPSLGRLAGSIEPGQPPFKRYACELDAPARLAPGDVGVWTLPAARIHDGLLHAPACDDLAALAAALAAIDVLRAIPAREDVRLLLTRAEEIGFVGALGAVRGESPILARGARVLALENSRAFPESPIGAGPIVRVGDRLTIFTPALTDAVAKRAEEHAASLGGLGRAPTASEKLAAASPWKWQRKLMAGGACEASVFCNAGYDATCICLPLGNYHNMGDLAGVQAGTNTRPPAIEPEFIGVADFEGLVDLLVACGERLPELAPDPARFEKFWNEKRFVLDEPAA